MAFSPDGARLATASGTTTRLWRVDVGDLVTTACHELSRNLSEAEWQRYVGDWPYHKTCPDLPMPWETLAP